MSNMHRKTLASEAMEAALKWSLLERVMECVKELQLKTTAERSNALVNDESTNSFLWVLEAVFIHGLSNSFLKMTSPFSSLGFMSTSLFSGGRRSGGGGGVDTAVPNPSFWEFVLVFLHRDIIDQIHSLHLVHTDVGRSRAWLRIALNDGILVSFLDNMTLPSNKRCLKAFYKPTALLRDTDKCDILKNYLVGIELLDFRLVINNSFLNQWNSGPLSLVGLWVDENETIQQGIDIAENLDSKEFQAIPRLQQSNTPPRFHSELEQQLRRQATPLLSEEDALRIILSNSPPHRKPDSPQPSTSKSSVVVPFVRQISSQKTERSKAVGKPLKPNLLPVDNSPTAPIPETVSAPNSSQEIISIITSNANNHVNVILSNEIEPILQALQTDRLSPTERTANDRSEGHLDALVKDTTKLELESPIIEQSYHDMLLKYQQRNPQEPQPLEEETDNNSSVSSRNTDSILLDQSNENHINSNENMILSSPSPIPESSVCSSDQNFKSTPTRKSSHHSRIKAQVDAIKLLKAPRRTQVELKKLMPKINKCTKVLPIETGLDSQNYACKQCKSSIGMFYGCARLCHFTGYSYCSNCHLNEKTPIPSRILLNWDFGMYTVSKPAYDFLQSLQHQPLFDIQEINPLLYYEINECFQVKGLRTKLFYISMYLKTCKYPKALEEVKEEAKGSKYMLNSIHLYSLWDLLNIPNRRLIKLLRKLVSDGTVHILSCIICREKGFICEICRNPKVLFPFELEKIYKCSHCGAVYHKECMNAGKNCPRCDRWKDKTKDCSNDINDNNA